MRLSVVIPGFNEARRLPATLEEAYGWLEQYMPGDYELIVVDDGSTDDTCACVERLQTAMPGLGLLRQPQNRGKGAAVRRGMLAASGDVRLFMDADHSTHVCEVEKVFAAMDEGADVVIASRQHPQSEIAEHQSWLREHMGQTFNALMRVMVGIAMRDTQCGFKAFTADAAEAIFAEQRLDGFSFDVELLYLAGLFGFEVAEIPVRWVNEEHSRVRLLTDPALMFVDLMRIRWMHRALERRSGG